MHRIAEGEYYEAHQQLRTIANRYVKSKDYPSAIELLTTGALLLLRAGQGGSGGDLCIYVIECYTKAELKPDTANKARLLSLLRAFPPNEPAKPNLPGVQGMDMSMVGGGNNDVTNFAFEDLLNLEATDDAGMAFGQDFNFG